MLRALLASPATPAIKAKPARLALQVPQAFQALRARLAPPDQKAKQGLWVRLAHLDQQVRRAKTGFKVKTAPRAQPVFLVQQDQQVLLDQPGRKAQPG